MAKKQPHPFWREQTRCYYVQLGKKQVRLHSDEKEAWRLYHELMARPPEAQAKLAPSSGGLLVVEVLDAFLDWAKVNCTRRTFEWRKDNLEAFARSIPRDLLAADIRPIHITREMNAHPSWGNDTRANFARCVQRAFRWAKRQGLIDANPVDDVEKPGRGRREEVYSREEYERILAAFPDRLFKDLVITAWETGCRPQELFAVETHHVDHAGKRWIFEVKNSKGKRRPRIVYLSDTAYEVTERLCREYVTGKLFRNADGKPWDKETAGRRFARKKKLLGKRYCLYGFRHSFATRKLLEGVDPITVAMLLGHANLSMLANQYSHLIKHPEHLRKALNQGSDA